MSNIKKKLLAKIMVFVFITSIVTQSGFAPLFKTSAATYSYQASTAFNSEFGVQGRDQWYYQQFDGSSYSNLTWNDSTKTWVGSQPYLTVTCDLMHPENSYEAVRKWVAPCDGSVYISGFVKKSDTQGGDGVAVRIMKNTDTIWGPYQIAYNDSVGLNPDKTTSVSAGDAIYFHVNKSGTVYNDTTYWDTLIDFTPTNEMDINQQNDVYGWTMMKGYGGTVRKTDGGINIQGNGRQALFNYFYGDKINNFDGFNTTINIDSIAKPNGANHDTYIGLQFGSTKDNMLVFSNAAPGFMLVIRPPTNTDTNTYGISAIFNNGSGIAGATTTMTSIVLESGNAISARLYKEQSGVWHLLLNGIDAGVDFSAIQSVLNQGGYFGVMSYENIATYANEQAVSITVRQVNGEGIANYLTIPTSLIVKSTKPTVSSTSLATTTDNGVQLSGRVVPNKYWAFKTALGSPLLNLNGFTTTFSVDKIDGYDGTSGVSNYFDFGISTYNASSTPPAGGVNSDRIDIWDYYGSPVTNARAVQIRFYRTSNSSSNTVIFILGSNGQYDPGTDVIGSKMAYTDTNGDYTVNLVNRNGNWDILVNGSSVLNEADTNKINSLNAEINALSVYGGTPFYLGGYDNLGSPVVDGNIALTVKNINGRLIGNNVYWGKTSENPAPSNTNEYNWTDASGFGGVSNTNLGINFQGNGRQALLNYFYGDKINNFDGFNTTININSIAKLNGANHNSYIGLQFGLTKDNVLVFSNAAPGFMLVLQPLPAANTYNVSAIFNNGLGIASVTTTMTSITLGSGGGIAVKLYKDQAGVWHLILNGIDAGVDFSSIQSIINQGGYFGIKAYENNAAYAFEQAVSLTVRQVNGEGMANYLTIPTSLIVKSTKPTVSSTSLATTTDNGVQLSGRVVPNKYWAFKTALGSPLLNLNGFTTTFAIDKIDGYDGTSGVSNYFDFGISTYNASSTPPAGGVNSDRIDIWDYYGSPVTNARAVQIRFYRTSNSSSNTVIFILGDNGQYDPGTDVIGSKMAYTDTNGAYTVNLVNRNGNWDILVNGSSVLNEADTNKINSLNAEINALSVYGGTPFYLGGYDSLGSPVVDGNIALTVKNINGRNVASKVPGYTEKMGLKKVLADFEYGLDKQTDPNNITDRTAPHYWDALLPTYSYIGVFPTNTDLKNIAATTSDTDNSNYWNVYPAQNGLQHGYADAIYVLNSIEKTNYENFSGYKNLRLIWNGTNPDSNMVNLNVSIYSINSSAWLNLGTIEAKSGDKIESAFNIMPFTSEQLSSISKIRFRTFSKDIGNGTNGTSYQKNELFYLDLFNTDTLTANSTIGDTSVSSEYLGSVMNSRFGPYSASGFYDPSDKKWKLWYGAGIAEQTCQDEVYYIETTDPQKGWTVPLNLHITNNTSLPLSVSPVGYGGDPSVVKVNETYYMYFSAVLLSSDGVNWYNKIYLATSSDGINFTLSPYIAADISNNIGVGYGSGSPSVVYKDGKFYMYYYSTYDLQGGGMLRTSNDGLNWSNPTRVNDTTFDVKYIDEINKWVGCYYGELNQFANPQLPGVRIVVSDDGVNWTRGDTDEQMPAQDFSAVINHNPGFIGTPEGHGFKTMFMTYGDNDLPLNIGSVYDMGLAGDTRQLFWSRVTFEPLLASNSAPNIIKGDINNDCIINIYDLVELKKHLLRISILEGAYKIAGDIDGNGNITISDLIALKKHLLGISFIT